MPGHARRPGEGRERNPWFPFLRGFAITDLEERDEPPELTEEDVLDWADAWYERTGEWPNSRSGTIPETHGETWLAVEAALSMGLRGFPGGSTLARFLAEHRDRYHLHEPPRVTVDEILAWADDWRNQAGDWPGHASGKIPGKGGMTWAVINTALTVGRCGLPGGSSLARLLQERRGVRNQANLPPLTEEQIVAWADAHHQRTGQWPTNRSGPIADAPGETWSGVEGALFLGARGLPGGMTLARVFAKHRGKYNPRAPRRLSSERVLAWADAWHARTGQWPSATDGTIPEAGGMTWGGVEEALRQGRYGFPGGSSLARLLAAERDFCDRGDRPPYAEEEILAWADAHWRRTGSWPNTASGAIAGTRFESWNKVDLALRYGKRGLPGGSSLGRLLAQQRGVKENVRSALDEATILAWADAHHGRTGEWPGKNAGAIVEAPGETGRRSTGP